LDLSASVKKYLSYDYLAATSILLYEMHRIEITCTFCQTKNIVMDYDWNISPENCERCGNKLPIPEEGTQKVVDFGYY
jgi:hypothetical protein